MDGVEASGHIARARALVEPPAALEANRERVDRLGRLGRHVGDDQAGVHSAGEQRAHRHIGDEVALHGVRHPEPEFFDVAARRAGRRLRLQGQ